MATDRTIPRYCEHCQARLEVAPKGPLPRFCSGSCRARAAEARDHEARSKRLAAKLAKAARPIPAPTGDLPILGDLVRRIGSRSAIAERDLPELSEAIEDVRNAMIMRRGRAPELDTRDYVRTLRLLRAWLIETAPADDVAEVREAWEQVKLALDYRRSVVHGRTAPVADVRSSDLYFDWNQAG